MRLVLGALASGVLFMVTIAQVSADSGPLPAPRASAGASPTSVSAGPSGQAAGISTESSGAAADQGGAAGYTCGGQASASGSTYSAQPAQAGTAQVASTPSCGSGSGGNGGQTSGSNPTDQNRNGDAAGSRPVNSLAVTKTGFSGPKTSQAGHSQGLALADSEVPFWPWLIFLIALLLILVGLVILALTRRRRNSADAS
jgi:hypothetical protein